MCYIKIKMVRFEIVNMIMSSVIQVSSSAYLPKQLSKPTIYSNRNLLSKLFNLISTIFFNKFTFCHLIPNHITIRDRILRRHLILIWAKLYNKQVVSRIVSKQNSKIIHETIWTADSLNTYN